MDFCILCDGKQRTFGKITKFIPKPVVCDFCQICDTCPHSIECRYITEYKDLKKHIRFQQKSQMPSYKAREAEIKLANSIFSRRGCLTTDFDVEIMVEETKHLSVLELRKEMKSRVEAKIANYEKCKKECLARKNEEYLL